GGGRRRPGDRSGGGPPGRRPGPVRHGRAGPGGGRQPGGRRPARGRVRGAGDPAAGGRDRVIRGLLADDQGLVRAGFRVVGESAPDIAVAGEAGNGEEAVALARSERPDVVLMDIRMPVLDGIEATRRIAADGDLAGCRVLVLTTFEADEYVFEALRAGASGFLLKDVEPADLLRAIRVVAGGAGPRSPPGPRRPVAAVAGPPPPRRAPARRRG